jgi:hypothetical protein
MKKTNIKDFIAFLAIGLVFVYVMYMAMTGKTTTISETMQPILPAQASSTTELCQKATEGEIWDCTSEETYKTLGKYVNWQEPPQENRKTIIGYITQYSRADSCHNIRNGECIMASGKPVYVGAVACPYSLSLGTKVIINEKIYTCEDRYARYLDARRGLPTFDIFVGSNPSGLYKKIVEIL